MRGVLKRRRPASEHAAAGGPAAGAGPEPTSCGLLTCPHCGLRLETLVFRCPRCLEDVPLGCSGDCRSCGKARR
jgi:hypothetical protein